MADARDLKSRGGLYHRVGLNPSPGIYTQMADSPCQGNRAGTSRSPNPGEPTRAATGAGADRAVEVRDVKIKLRQDVVGRRVLRVWRAGKNIIFDLSGGLHIAGAFADDGLV